MKNFILAASVVFVGACGGDEPVHKGTVNPTGARTSVESLHDVFAALDTSSGEGAASAVLSLTAAGQIIVTPSGAREQLPVEAFMPLHWEASKASRNLTGSATCNANGCVFDHYGDTTSGASYSINGSISRNGDELTFDLTYDVTSQGLDFHWNMDGHVRVNATLIDGEVHSDGDATVSSDGRTYHVGWDVDVDYNAIGLDGTGCPISGSLSATVGYSVSGAQSGTYRAAGSVSFGPACGQFQAN